jgi:hypothetical protein
VVVVRCWSWSRDRDPARPLSQASLAVPRSSTNHPRPYWGLLAVPSRAGPGYLDPLPKAFTGASFGPALVHIVSGAEAGVGRPVSISARWPEPAK